MLTQEKKDYKNDIILASQTDISDNSWSFVFSTISRLLQNLQEDCIFTSVLTKAIKENNPNLIDTYITDIGPKLSSERRFAINNLKKITIFWDFETLRFSTFGTADSLLLRMFSIFNFIGLMDNENSSDNIEIDKFGSPFFSEDLIFEAPKLDEEDYRIKFAKLFLEDLSVLEAKIKEFITQEILRFISNSYKEEISKVNELLSSKTQEVIKKLKNKTMNYRDLSKSNLVEVNLSLFFSLEADGRELFKPLYGITIMDIVHSIDFGNAVNNTNDNSKVQKKTEALYRWIVENLTLQDKEPIREMFNITDDWTYDEIESRMREIEGIDTYNSYNSIKLANLLY